MIPAEFRTGDFSRLLTEQGIQLYNPLTTDAAGNRQPFPNNQIPLSLFNPSARTLFNSPDLYPLPTNSALRFNQTNVESTYLKSDQGDIKLDWKPSDEDYVNARYSKGRQDRPTINTFPLIYNQFDMAPFQAGVVNWTRTIRPTIVNELRVGVNNILYNTGGEDKGLGNIAQTLGIAGVPTGLMEVRFPADSFARNLGSPNIGTQTLFANTTYHYADNLTLIRGRHMMKTGGQVLRQHMNSFYAGNNGRTGFINFNGQYTQGPNANAPATKGFPEADFVLGFPARLGRGLSTGTWGHRKWIYGFYFQDDWRASDTLTLNLGLRWEYHTPLVEVADRQSNFSPFTGEMLLPGQNGEPRALYHGFKKDWQPRVGFAWTPSFLGRNTVIRGAYTISSFMEGTGTNLRLPLNPPFNTEFEAIYEGQATIGADARPGPAPAPLRRPVPRRQHPAVGPVRASRQHPAVELHYRAETRLEPRHDGGLCGPEGHAPGGAHAVLPAPPAARRHDRTQPLSLRQPATGQHRADLRHRIQRQPAL